MDLHVEDNVIKVMNEAMMESNDMASHHYPKLEEAKEQTFKTSQIGPA